MVTDDMKMLQNIYDEEHKSVTQISGLKIQAENEEINNEISKVGKIIHIPFKGIVKYIGDNNFVVINFWKQWFILLLKYINLKFYFIS